MKYEDLVINFNALCEKCNKAIARANNEMALRACLEIDLNEGRRQLKVLMQENSELKYRLSQQV